MDWDTGNLGMPSILLLRVSTAVGTGYSYVGYPEIFLATKKARSILMKVRSRQHYYRHMCQKGNTHPVSEAKALSVLLLFDKCVFST